MKTKYNIKMKAILDQYGISEFSDSNVQIPEDLQNIVRDEIYHENECYFLKHNFQLCKGVTSKDFPDLTGYECYVNRVNIDDYVDPTNLKDFIRNAFCFIHQLERLLSRYKQKFVIILGLEIDDIVTAAIRFHKLRENETWLNADLEKYVDEGILVKEI